MNTESYFSQYESPNIVIIPNMSLCNPPSPKKRKIGNNILVPIVDNATCEKLNQQERDKSQVPNTCTDKKVDKNINSPKTPNKKGSWATNYLQSIGLDSKSSIWQHKIPRNNASKRCASENTIGAMKSNVIPNSTCSTNTDSEKCGQLKTSKAVIKTNSVEVKSNQETKNYIQTQKTKKQKDSEKHLPTKNTQSPNVDISTVGQKYVNSFQKNSTPITFSNANKNKDNIILPKKTEIDIPHDNLNKRPKDDCVTCTSPIENHSLSQKNKKAVKTEKQPNSKILTDRLKLIHKQGALKNDDKSKCLTKAKSNCREKNQHILKNTKRSENSKKRSKSSTSYSSDNLKTRYKAQQCSIGHVTSVKSVVKVTKKYDMNDLNKLTTSKKSNKIDEPVNTSASDQKKARKGTYEILSKQKLDSKPKSVKHKKIINSPIKKQPHKAKKYRKIKLVINVVCNNKPISESSKSNDVNVSTASTIQNVDLDFLNDFDVDEIVQSLDICDRETKNLESKISLNKEDSNVNTNIISEAYDNDALDLIKILKGEEDDDLIKQSIEGTPELLFSNNIRTHTPCIDNDNTLDHAQSCDKLGIIAHNESVTPIKIKEEKQEINVPKVATDSHGVESTYDDNHSNYVSRIIYKQDTPTLNSCADLVEDFNNTITNDIIGNNEEANTVNTNNQVKNDMLHVETNKDVRLTVKETGINNEKCTEIIIENNESTSVNQVDTPDVETVKNMINDVVNVAENTDNRENRVDISFTEICDIEKGKEVKLGNDEVEITDTIQERHNTANLNQSINDIPDGKMGRGKTATPNHDINNKEKTIVILEKLKHVESELTGTKSTEVKDDNNDGNKIHSFSERNDYDNKEKENSKIHNKSISNDNIVHTKLTSNVKQDQEINKDPKKNNDKEKKSEKEVNKDFNNSKAKANNDESASSSSCKKINKKALLSTPLNTDSFQKLNINVDTAQKLEQRMFAYLGTKYSILSTIHQGKFSKIFKCKHPSGKLYALKSLNTNHTMNMQKKHMLYSLQNGRPKNDLFTVNLVSAFSFAKKWYILMDYYPKNLEQVLSEVDKPFCIESVQEYARQLVTAVLILKSNNMVHSDIKPQHILINTFNNTLKLCGFDNLSYVNQMNALPCVGTASYRAPELILGYSAGFEIDVWSTAMVLYEMAVKQKLIPGVFNNDILYKQICTLGTVPNEMVKKSIFSSKHFSGTMFMRRSGFKGQKISIIKNIVQNNKLRKSIYDAYRHYWAHQRNLTEQNFDYKKLASFVTLLEKMLVMHPRYRISIEYVLDNIFIYDVY